MNRWKEESIKTCMHNVYKFSKSFHTSSWLRSPKQKCWYNILTSVSEALALIIKNKTTKQKTNKSLGENSGPVSFTKKKKISFCSAWVLYSVKSCIFLLEFLLITKNQRPSERQKIKHIKVHFMLPIYNSVSES